MLITVTPHDTVFAVLKKAAESGLIVRRVPESPVDARKQYAVHYGTVNLDLVSTLEDCGVRNGADITVCLLKE